MARLDDVASNQSTFTDDAKFGKDPFFPKSIRRVPKVITPEPKSMAIPDILNAIRLTGISGGRNKRLAMLNNRTVGVGEVTDFRFNNQTFKVRCLEIRERSVLLGVEGSPETKEVHLRSGM